MLKDAKQVELASGALTARLKADLNTSLYNIDDLKLDYHVKDAKGAETASGTLTGKIAADVGQATYAIDDVKFQGKLPLPIAGSQPTDVSAGWATARLNPTTQQLSVTGVSLKAWIRAPRFPGSEGTNMIDRRRRAASSIARLSMQKLLTTLGIALPAGMDAERPARSATQ